MERTAALQLKLWNASRPGTLVRTKFVTAALIGCVLLLALLATLVPLKFSIVTVLLFAGPHNLFEFRYFLMRMPVRLGRSRNFFLVAFGGIFALTTAYLSLPVLFYVGIWSGSNWFSMISVWNTLLLLWVATLVWMRGRQRKGRDWFWAWPLALGLTSLNWWAPDVFSLALVYAHPLIAFWFVDRQLRHKHSNWLLIYRRCLALLPVLILLICWQFARTPSLAEDNGLAWRIAQHSGAEILPSVSSHMLVSVHVFLEMLHYVIWVLVLPLLCGGKVWNLESIPLVRHPRGFPLLITAAMIVGVLLMGLLWLGFSLDYSSTRDIYFAVAISHVLAEAPFLLRTM